MSMFCFIKWKFGDLTCPFPIKSPTKLQNGTKTSRGGFSVRIFLRSMILDRFVIPKIYKLKAQVCVRDVEVLISISCSQKS